MINKRIVEKKTYELIDSLAFKQYEVRAKDQEYNRLNGLPTFRVKEPNTGVIKSYTVQLTADFKNNSKEQQEPLTILYESAMACTMGVLGISPVCLKTNTCPSSVSFFSQAKNNATKAFSLMSSSLVGNP